MPKKQKHEHFTSQELKKIFRSQDDIETRRIFEILKRRALGGEPLTVAEQDRFCGCVQFSMKPDGSVFDYDVCEGYIFDTLYMIYGSDLTGGSVYTRPNGLTREIVPRVDAQHELNILERMSQEWHTVINKTNHSEPLLQVIAAETRYWIKSLENNPAFNDVGFFRRCNRYEFFLKQILLYSKWLYRVCLEIFEEAIPGDFVLTLNGREVEMTEYSFVHILFRHFGQTLKPFDFEKSFHDPKFHPRILHKQLRIIFETLDQANIRVISPGAISNIPLRFTYRGTPYLVYLNKRVKQIVGAGNVDFLRLETFFIISTPEEIYKLELEFDEVAVNSVVSVYSPKD